MSESTKLPFIGIRLQKVNHTTNKWKASILEQPPTSKASYNDAGSSEMLEDSIMQNETIHGSEDESANNDLFLSDYSFDDTRSFSVISNDCSDSSNMHAEVRITKTTRKRKAIPSQWKRNRAKFLRNSGRKYFMQKFGEMVPRKQIRRPCKQTKCIMNCTAKISQEERLLLFRKYWKLADFTRQRVFIKSCMQEVVPKYRGRNTAGSKRTPNHAFYLRDGENKTRVCKLFFTSTLGITNRCIRTVISKGTDLFDNRGSHENHKKVDEDVKTGVRAHIASIPRIESHYTRAHTEKEFIEGGMTIMQLYRNYKRDCERDGRHVAKLCTYRNIFNYEFNIAFFVPKKDQCQRCVTFENSTEERKSELETEHLKHLMEKELSRAEKENDKTKIDDSFQVACFDLQATLPTPRGDVSSFYYKSKLSTYNFTVCDLSVNGQGVVNCYVWHEGEGKRGAVEIGSCLLDYLKKKAELSTGDLDIVFYSDNCGGQQKNKYIIATYLYAVANYNINSITHKFLVTGHTQNEGDCAHSLIEKNIKRALRSGPIYVPAQYVALIQTAKKTGVPFQVSEMNHGDFFDIKNMTEQTSANFNQNASGIKIKFNEVAIFKVEKQHLDKFFYKMSYSEDDYETVNIRERRVGTRARLTKFEDVQLEQAYSDSLAISKQKHNDLMFLLRANAIIANYGHFYNSLKSDG